MTPNYSRTYSKEKSSDIWKERFRFFRILHNLNSTSKICAIAYPAQIHSLLFCALSAVSNQSCREMKLVFVSFFAQLLAISNIAHSLVDDSTKRIDHELRFREVSIYARMWLLHQYKVLSKINHRSMCSAIYIFHKKIIEVGHLKSTPSVYSICKVLVENIEINNDR